MHNYLLLSYCIVFSMDREKFYPVFSHEKSEEIGSLITQLQTDIKDAQDKAYLGTLLMKKAGIERSLKKKLDLFKEGHKLLEAAIMAEPNNAEFHFLRLTIQENAPSILGYKHNIQEDKKKVIDEYNRLDPIVKKYIRNYCATSKTLHISDLP
jgi:hypothetical protein